MASFRRQEGVAVVTAIVLMAIMLVMGATMLALVDAQTQQTSEQRSAESSFDLAEATLSAGEFLLAHNWPQAVTGGSCDSQTISGTLAEPADSAPATLTTQVQRLLAQTYDGAAPSSSRWWVTVCDWAQTQYSSWDKSLQSTAPATTRRCNRRRRRSRGSCGSVPSRSWRGVPVPSLAWSRRARFRSSRWATRW